jgi:hypothetical protein
MQNTDQTPKTERFLFLLNEIIIAKGGHAGDLTNWDEVLTSMTGRSFDNLDNLVKTINLELKRKTWINKERKKIIISRVDQLSSLIKAWQ